MKNVLFILSLLLSLSILTSCITNKTDEMEITSTYISTINELENQLTSKEMKIDQLLAENKHLNEEIEELKSKQSQSNLQYDIQKPEVSTYLKDGAIDLYAQIYDNEGEIMRPAFGPAAELNSSAINIEGNIKLIEKGINFSKVSIVGYIPTWYLTDENKGNLSGVYENKYLIKDTYLYLSPDKKDKMLRQLSRGRAVKVKYEHTDWYYIELMYGIDACLYTHGWVKKDSIGELKSFSTVEGIDVQLRYGSDEYRKVKEIMGKHYDDIWGRILSEEEDTYAVTFPGAFGEEVAKSNVLFIGDY